ncbi:glycoside hydrolase family 32 protein [Aplosporella prunicola CBS 121167]|uniref:Glycoside hydrolase family 32 protein n=1 Tax=Aplosporella prunicola CBS 121167 TaxID=1176127 RepID=A0A6A6BH99_9PEZI|nr:glycoside hydrolase family 32 protein [Aplosporella prunicola CBS 121167]KAF2143522.1 glycoside hydrolase family 32 protein [Aplosporella prunicola CBS 121167]
MVLSTASPTWGALLALASVSYAAFPADQHIPPSLNLSALDHNSLFTRWRPSYHVAAPAGHMNDPCGPMYDPLRDEYHIFYQAFPNHVGFGNTTWCHAKSKDLVTWTDVKDWRNRGMVAIEPGPAFGYDWLGDFSGGSYATNLHGEADGNLTLFYTGSRSQPDFWQDPYKPRTETQNAATSSDGGLTWQKWEGNPILDGAPGGWNVTGLRDPNFAPIPELSEILGLDPSTFYITIGSGIREVGPRAPHWTAPANNITDWTFHGSLFEVPINYTWGGDRNRTGNFGGNFEMATLYPLVEKEENGGDGKTKHWVYNFGAEGFESFGHPLTHWSLFALGTVSRRDNGSAEFTIRASAPTDWGNSYAVNTFWDPKGKRRIAWGWSDEDFAKYGLQANGYQGSLTLPRELYIQKTHNVVAPAGGAPEESGEIWQKDANGKTYTVTTLAQRPLPDVVAGLQGNKSSHLGDVTVDGETKLNGLQSDTYHLQATLEKWPENGQVGVKVRASPDQEEYTEIYYTPSNYTLTLNRDHSTLIPHFNRTAFNGYYEPYVLASSNGSAAKPEPLTFNIFVDGSLLEIFINDRLSLTSRIYPSRTDALGAALVSTGGEALFKNVTFWDRMARAFPQRPANSSSPLHEDPYYMTHVLQENEWVDVGYQIYDGI